MKDLSTIELVENEIRNVLNGTEISRQSELLKEDLGLDSLSLVSVIVGIEEKLDVQFDDGDLDPAKLLTVADLAGLVERYR